MPPKKRSPIAIANAQRSKAAKIAAEVAIAAGVQPGTPNADGFVVGKPTAAAGAAIFARFKQHPDEFYSGGDASFWTCFRKHVKVSDAAVCIGCGSWLSTSAATTSLRKHIESHCATLKTTAPPARDPRYPEDTLFDLYTRTNAAMEESKEVAQKRQPAIDQFMKAEQQAMRKERAALMAVDALTEQDLNRLYVHMMADGNLPLRFGDNVPFQAFILRLGKTAWAPPSRMSIGPIIDQVYLDMFTVLQQALVTAQDLSFTTDLMTLPISGNGPLGVWHASHAARASVQVAVSRASLCTGCPRAWMLSIPVGTASALLTLPAVTLPTCQPCLPLSISTAMRTPVPRLPRSSHRSCTWSPPEMAANRRATSLQPRTPQRICSRRCAS
jgi:hypothetical protein